MTKTEAGWRVREVRFFIVVRELSEGRIPLKRKRPDYSGLPMRTKRLNHRSWPRYHELSSDAALRTTPYFTHDNPHFCINDVTNLPDPLSPASHQFWLHDETGL